MAALPDPDKESVAVVQREGSSRLCIPGEKISLSGFGSRPLAVSDIFQL